MVNYRRTQNPGGIYFFTVVLQNRNSTLLIDQISLLGDSMRKTKIKYPYETLAIVVLPDHLHCIWELPKNDSNFSLRWQEIKKKFTKEIREINSNLNKNAKGEYNLWQRRFWEHCIRDETDLENHINYIHYNPVKHGLVNKVKDWPHSSFHRYVTEGIVDQDWASDYTNSEFGE